MDGKLLGEADGDEVGLDEGESLGLKVIVGLDEGAEDTVGCEEGDWLGE